MLLYRVAFTRSILATTAPVAPGTFGSLVGIPLTLWLLPAYGDLGFGLLILGAFAIGVWACDITGKRLGVTDYGGIVWDEVVAMMLILWFVPLRPWWESGEDVARAAAKCLWIGGRRCGETVLFQLSIDQDTER